MAKHHNPEQEAFKHRDQVNDAKDETSERLSLEANAAQTSDKTAQKEKTESFTVADAGDTSIEQTLGTLLSSIAEKASRLPASMREELVANNSDLINPALLAVVKNPQQFTLGDRQDPDAVKAFLARVSKG